MITNALQIQGVIHTINLPVKVTDKFTKREFVMITEQDTAWPQFIPLELHNFSTDIIDAYRTGMEVVVDFQPKGRQWTDPQGEVKTFLTLVAWKIQPVKK